MVAAGTGIVIFHKQRTNKQQCNSVAKIMLEVQHCYQQIPLKFFGMLICHFLS